MTNDDNMVAGLYCYPPHDKAPDFVILDQSIHRDRLIAWLNRHEVNEKGYIKIQTLRSQANKLYARLNEYKKPDQPRERQPEQSSHKPELSPETQRAVDEFGGSVVDDDVPF